jgi:hypothetical protein
LKQLPAKPIIMKQIILTKYLLVIPLCFLTYIIKSQNLELSSGNRSYVGKYESKGMIVQVAVIKKELVLIVPGAPVQQLKPIGANKFTTNTFRDEIFLFIRNKGKVISMLNRQGVRSLELKKISDVADNFNGCDSLLTLKKATRHFVFLYSSIDSVTVFLVAERLEASYKKIVTNLKVMNMPVTVVRIYPSITSFHQGINFPNAPDNVLATAFGKNDFRMASPNIKGLDSQMLIKGVTHEFTHCVHLNIDYSPNNPRWLWEGVAMFESDWFFDPGEIDVIKNRNFPSLSALNNGMEYMLGFVIIEAIKDIWGFDTVIRLIKQRGNTQAVMKLNPKEFEARIYDHIYNKYIKKQVEN